MPFNHSAGRLLRSSLLTAALASSATGSLAQAPSASEPGPDREVAVAAPPPREARLRGVVRYAGASPLRLKTFSNDLDVEACGSRVASRAVRAGHQGALADALVEVRTADGRLPPSAKWAASPTPVEVSLTGCSFEPHVLVIPAGTEVEVLNPDGILHAIRGLSLRNEPVSSRLQRYRRRLVLGTEHFRRPERLRVSCERHSWSAGWWVTTDNRFHALTGSDGRFVIEGLPAGTYLVTAWHGEFPPVEKEAILAPGEELELDFELR